MSGATNDYDAHGFEYVTELLLDHWLLLGKFNVIKVFVVSQVSRGCEEACHLHHFIAGVLQHVDLALG